MKNKIKTMIVDDTITYRNIIKQAVSTLDSIEVINLASNGEIALEKIKQDRPDLILLDVEMPVLNGLETLEEIKKNYADIEVIMISGTNTNSTDITIKALELGAIDFIKKPEGNDIDSNIATIRDSLKPILEIYQSKKTTVLPVIHQPSKTAKPIASSAINIEMKFDLIAIGCSTGGPTALMNILPKIPQNIPVPIVIVQHMPAGFTESLSRNLNNKSRVKVSECKSGDTLQAGNVYIAPGSHHMLIKKISGTVDEYEILLSDAPPENNCKPAVDVTFKSLAKSFNGNILSIILTGMGSDGLVGVKALKERGNCLTITQSEESCVVYGMPRVVELAGLSDISLPLDNISYKINNLFNVKENSIANS